MNIVKCAECGNEYDDDYPALGRVSRKMKMDVPICPLCQVLIEEAYLEVMSKEGTGKEGISQGDPEGEKGGE